MKIIATAKASGKTTELIKLSAEKFIYIVCANRKECDRIAKHARELKLDIPYPITYGEFLGASGQGKGINGVAIDNVEWFLQTLPPIEIQAITVTKED